MFVQAIHKYLLIPILFILISCGMVSPPVQAAGQDDMKTIPEWSIMWGGPDSVEELVKGTGEWIAVSDLRNSSAKPEGITSAWIKIKLPATLPNHYGVFISELFTQHLAVYLENQLIQENHRNFQFDVQRLLIPLSSEDAGKTVYLKLGTAMTRIGIHSDIQIGQNSNLIQRYVIQDMGNIILGFAFLFIAFIMLISSMFLKKVQLTSWISLIIVILAMGTIFITSVPFIYDYYSEYGTVISNMFDIALAVCLPSLSYYFEKIFDSPTELSLFRKFRKFQILYSVFLLSFMIVNQFLSLHLAKMYFTISVTIQGSIMLVQFVLLLGFSFRYVLRGNKDAVIFSTGFGFFSLMGVIDLFWFYFSKQMHELFLWKWGMVGFIIMLIVILGRRLATYQDQIVNYSRELEFYNKQLLQSEKMEIISALAASIAHEVRNPLQVTRGFLQLVAGKSDTKNRQYMEMAIDELDRASHIITDFLTFAKPQMEDLSELNVSKELKQIEGIIVPLATLHGGKVLVDIPQELYIRGNSSKLKQALINIIKNSIEAFHKEGQIDIWAYKENGKVFIHIKDNGEGIESSKLAKLGEPYFSTKTKGTGLGLMVTFRIIEAMRGSIEFKSQIQVGTEVIIKLPAFNSS
ncbi:ATP-binding protein [Paenibacillus sp. GCM10027628]|uniref:ATP-binding protein n=1 Tax=Paenibacillus sp. GCM10027628 TaxID=3273413 RepID=UPI0036274BC1